MADETTPPVKNAKSVSKSNVPAADIDFDKVATDVAEAWIAKPIITLVWTTSAAFAADAAKYNDELSSRKQVGGSRPQITQGLKTLDKQMDDGLTYVKGYIVESIKRKRHLVIMRLLELYIK